MARKVLKAARQQAGMTQQQMADFLKISLRHYKFIEAGTVIGSVDLWDKMEDLTGIHQRKLREISENRRAPEESR